MNATMIGTGVPTDPSAIAESSEPAVELARLRSIAGSVSDPEVPVLTLDDLGIVRDLRLVADGVVEVDLTPTYTGCPATAVIASDVDSALRAAGVERVVVRTVLSPAWSTDWMSASGRRKLLDYGIAPPGACGPPTERAVQEGLAQEGLVQRQGRQQLIGLVLSARCPRCGSTRTREISRFGSTPCKALWSCLDCSEPFDSFKAI